MWWCCAANAGFARWFSHRKCNTWGSRRKTVRRRFRSTFINTGIEIKAKFKRAQTHSSGPSHPTLGRVPVIAVKLMSPMKWGPVVESPDMSASWCTWNSWSSSHPSNPVTWNTHTNSFVSDGCFAVSAKLLVMTTKRCRLQHKVRECPWNEVQRARQKIRRQADHHTWNSIVQIVHSSKTHRKRALQAHFVRTRTT